MTARFEHSVDDAHALRRGFTGLYWLLAALLAIGGIFRRELLVVAAVFAVVLLVWGRAVGRAMPTRPWVLEIDRERITVDRNGAVDSVDRSAAVTTRFVRRHSRGASWSELQVLGPRKQRLLREGVRDDHRAGVARALEEHGWPTSR